MGIRFSKISFNRDYFYRIVSKMINRRDAIVLRFVAQGTPLEDIDVISVDVGYGRFYRFVSLNGGRFYTPFLADVPLAADLTRSFSPTTVLDDEDFPFALPEEGRSGVWNEDLGEFISFDDKDCHAASA